MKKSTGDIIFVIGLFLLLVQFFMFEAMLNKGMPIFPHSVSLGQLIFDLISNFWRYLIGIVGLIMAIVGAKHMNKANKK